MFGNFETYIRDKGLVTEEEVRLMLGKATARKFRRRQLLLREGDVCQHKIFVSKGLLRTYRLKEDGTETIMRFAAENSWIVDHQSYHNQTPTKYNIEAIEDSEVILWTRENFEGLLLVIPTLRDLSERLRIDNLHASQDRILMNISATSEEKYQEFVNAFPEVFRRVPLHMVASYLGVSRETLSRIRHAQQRGQ
ncbi:MAG TPA: Crp/Fnr family transcriptional regulator [Puia sp.]|nr:Crp/Fnr family transcriptional regulator [Puia sp.]